ncbi:SIS domain-containing protein [Streptomyces luomodiensis]|uniref:SIS domain-containing protein n=1 Tax=Streptomyces luomodiensis TaxID=3026192 RepID=A0ABY9VE13_9ACTN|nr:SIS domain-containing protein [Streptomyces sp. SCA4-21]WNF00180.1 SIS domain-containing protein [Streptomyces sp. SCA4-21]
MSHTSDEIASQPECWERAVSEAPRHAKALPAPGERVAVIGCGTSLFMAQAYARLREGIGHGITDAYPASEARLLRPYDRILALTRSGTTTEIVSALEEAAEPARITTVTAVADSPATAKADEVICLDYADERSVVQTRFPTTELLLLRAHLGLPTDDALADVATALASPLPDELTGAEQITFLGADWSVGVAHEAALKVREAAAHWTESYSAMEYRHGPIAVARAGRAVWSLTPVADSLADRVGATGAYLRQGVLDPLAELVLAQRLAVRLAENAGRNPDRPEHLTRSVILGSQD